MTADKIAIYNICNTQHLLILCYSYLYIDICEISARMIKFTDLSGFIY